MIASFESQVRRPIRRLWTQAPAYKWTAIGTLLSTFIVFFVAVPPAPPPPAHKPDEWKAQVPEKKTTYQPAVPAPSTPPAQGKPQAANQPAQHAPTVGPTPSPAQPAGAPTVAAKPQPPQPKKLKPLESGDDIIRVERPVEKTDTDTDFGVIRKTN
jgi:hypothetical protein